MRECARYANVAFPARGRNPSRRRKSRCQERRPGPAHGPARGMRGPLERDPAYSERGRHGTGVRPAEPASPRASPTAHCSRLRIGWTQPKALRKWLASLDYTFLTSLTATCMAEGGGTGPVQGLAGRGHRGQSFFFSCMYRQIQATCSTYQSGGDVVDSRRGLCKMQLRRSQGRVGQWCADEGVGRAGVGKATIGDGGRWRAAAGMG